MDWLKDTSGEQSASFTLAIVASVVAIASFAASMFGFVTHPVTGTECAALVAPFLGIYGWRRSVRTKDDDSAKNP
jgi:hypothetical protein